MKDFTILFPTALPNRVIRRVEPSRRQWEEPTIRPWNEPHHRARRAIRKVAEDPTSDDVFQVA